MDDTLMRIGEIAAFFDVSVKALRIYEKMGILTPVLVDEGTGYRYYSADQVRQLDAILELKSLGFSLIEIKGLLKSNITQDEYMKAFTRKKTMLQEQISLMQEKIEGIDEAITKLAQSEPPTKLHRLSEDERALLMSKMICVKELHARHILSEALWL